MRRLRRPQTAIKPPHVGSDRVQGRRCVWGNLRLDESLIQSRNGLGFESHASDASEPQLGPGFRSSFRRSASLSALVRLLEGSFAS